MLRSDFCACCRERRGGRDHIWLVTFDEASCYVPAAIRSSSILSQWGRKDLNHTANTGWVGEGGWSCFVLMDQPWILQVCAPQQYLFTAFGLQVLGG
jgi:hypothetical protein